MLMSDEQITAKRKNLDIGGRCSRGGGRMDGRVVVRSCSAGLLDFCDNDTLCGVVGD